MSEQMLDLAVVRIDGDTQPRVAIDQLVVKEYAEVMQAGTTLPPVEVVHDGVTYWLVDGFHRYFAHRMLDLKQIKANVTTGMQADAKWKSLSANKTHGLHRTNADKAKAVMKALQLRENLGDGVIADHVGVHLDTVVKYRRIRAAQSTYGNSVSGTKPAGPTTRRGRDGRVLNTARIGQASKARCKPGGIHPRAFKPVRTCSPPAPMTALSMPHDPEMGARTLIQLFDAGYLRAVVAFISKHLEGVQA